jgi:phosphoglycolate phosphatase
VAKGPHILGGVSEPVVLFDLDGTLVDSEPGIRASHHHTLATFGLEADDATVRRWIGAVLREALLGLGIPEGHLEEAVAAYRCHYAATGIYQSRLYDGVVEMLRALATSGATLCVATSKLTTSADQVLEHSGISSYFKFVAGSTPDRSREGKEAIIAHVLDLLGRRALGVVSMVGDTKWDVRGAVRNGARPIGVTWGYGTEAELRAAGAEVIVAGPAELTAIFRPRGATTC